MLRRLFTLAVFVSLMMCVAVIVIRMRSRRGSDDHMTIRTSAGAAPYTLRCEPQGFYLYRPLEKPTSQGDAEVLIARIANDQLEWQAERPLNWRPSGWTANRTAGPWEASPGLRRDSAAAELHMRSSRAIAWHQRQFPLLELVPDSVMVPHLLEALYDPQRFAVAHVLLTRLQRTYAHGWEERADGSFVQVFDGLRAHLAPQADTTVWHSYGDDSEIIPCTASFDRAQMAQLRDQWHRRLNVPSWSVRYSHLTAATGALPALWAAGASLRLCRRWKRSATGCCRTCGYDLRATPGRCPECGAAAATPGG